MEHFISNTLQKLIKPDLTKLPKITIGEQETKIIKDMPAEQYHADKDRMSSTALRRLLKSPRSFLATWTGLEKEDEEDEPDYFRIGRAAHMALLEQELFRKTYVIEPIHQGFTKDGKPTTSANAESVKAAKELWRAQQKPDALILSEKEMEMLLGMLESVLEHKIANGLLKDGQPETTLQWIDIDTGVWCRARPDYLVQDKNGGLHVIDFKTTRDIQSGFFATEIVKKGYHTQLAFYHDGVMECFGKQPQSLTIIATEKKYPYETAVHILHDQYFEKGQELYKHALGIYKRCIEENNWPSYSQSAAMIQPPNSIQYQTLPEFQW